MTGPSVSNLRRRAEKLGFRFIKSNWRKDSIDNLGGYQVIEIARNLVVDGSRFDCDLGDVADFITRQEAAA